MDTIIMDGDQVNFFPVFGNASVSVQPGKMIASGKTTIKGKKVCVAGDEAKVEVTNCAYIAGSFIGGLGTLTIKKLDPGQLTKKSKSGTKSIIIKGNMFKAEFTVVIKGIDPSNGKPDEATVYEGEGQFAPINTKIQAR